MNSKVEVKLDYDAVGQFLKNDVIPILEDKANEIASALEDSEIVVGNGTTRAWVNVWTSNYENNEPLKAMR